MLKLIQRTYNFSDFQIAQLKFCFLSFFSEISKLLLIGLFFKDNLLLYAWALLIFQIVRSSSGGWHCKTYLGCFCVSLGYMLLSIRFLPLIHFSKFIQMSTLLLCIIASYNIGPLTSPIHPLLTDTIKKHLKIKLFYIIFFYLVLIYIFPQNIFTNVGYWVIILNTLQQIAAKFLRKDEKQHETKISNTL